MNGLMAIKTYREFEEAFDREVRNQADSFIRMGYLLRIAQDTDILYESGYATIAEFAKQKYNLSADYVSRMIDVNKRYSDGGYSDRLLAKYQGYGYTLLSEMLSLPDQVIDALPDGTTREGIREIKREIREEQKITDLEVMLEAAPLPESLLVQVLKKYYYENRREYPKLHKALSDGMGKQEALDLLAPGGTGVKFARIPGVGKLMLSVKGKDRDLELLNVRTNEKEAYSWEEGIAALSMLSGGTKSYSRDWEKVYGEPFHGEEEKPDQAAEQTPDLPKAAERKIAPAQMPPEPPEPEEADRSPEKHDLEPEEQRWKSEKCDQNTSKRDQNTEKCDQEPAKHNQEPEQAETAAAAGNQTETPEAGREAAGEPVQQDIGAYKDVIPDGYQPDAEVITPVEATMWKEATQRAERLYNTLQGNDWNPDCIKVVSEMRMEAETLKGILESMEILMETE